MRSTKITACYRLHMRSERKQEFRDQFVFRLTAPLKEGGQLQVTDWTLRDEGGIQFMVVTYQRRQD